MLVALNVDARPPFPNVAYANIPAALDEQRRDNEARIARFDAPAGADAPRVERCVIVGDIAERIVETARDTSADLVVLASEPRTAPARVLGRGVTDTVVRDVPCHVLVVRAEA